MGGGVWKTLAVHRDTNRLANLTICRLDDLPICRLDDKKCFLKIGEIKRRGKYSSEFYYANRNHLEETV